MLSRLDNLPRHRFGFALILPALLLLLVLIAYPLISSILLSFRHYYALDPDTYWVGLRNYVDMYLYNGRFWTALRNSLIYTFGGTFFKLLIGLGTALMLNQEFRGRTLARALLLVPWLIPDVSWAMAFRWLYSDQLSIISRFLMDMNVIEYPILFLGTREWAMPSVLTAGILKGYPIFMVMILAGLQSIPQERYEAAEVDGASILQRFRYITLPGVRTVMLIAWILGVVWTINSFAIVWLLTRGGPFDATHLLITLAFEFAFVLLRYHDAAVLSVTILFILIPVLIVFRRYSQEEV